MNTDLSQRETCLTVPDDTSAIRREAIPPPAQPAIVIREATDLPKGFLPNDSKVTRQLRNYYGLPLAQRGLLLLGVDIAIASTWYVSAWITNDRQPLIHTYPRMGIGTVQSPILPPDLLMGVIACIALISFVMMFLGTQDDNPSLKVKKDRP
jgi:hypothetical protein